MADASDGARRTLTDKRGRAWTVYEQTTPHEEWSTANGEHYGHGYGVGWLLFELGTTRKRLRLYPVGWHTLPEPELQRLCSRARRFE